ncbi:hypothetical protein [Mucilaginibacter sp.]|uniref:hypothetical protein n=1 Tax=Mucilaginibacter sp. TaxID=1882438 RepID=UPI0025FBBAC1|nr:hypothetical protein [Mucilaginibacter sp.]
MRKSSKRLIISTEAINSFGFRVLTSGIDLSQYRLNPILLWMHVRTNGNSKDQILPLGFVSDLEVNGTELSGIPNFDDTDEFAMKIYNKVENGTIRMCSPGLLPLEQSDAPAMMMPGQTLPTVVKSVMIEVSIADIGSNPNALAVELYDIAGHSIKLSAGTAKAVISSIASSGNGHGTNPNSNHHAATLAIVDNAVKAGKFTKGEASTLLTAGAHPAGVAAIHQKVKEAKIVPERLTGSMPEALKPLVAKSWDELKMAWGDDTKRLKEHAPEVYKAKFFEKNGRMPAERDGKPL